MLHILILHHLLIVKIDCLQVKSPWLIDKHSKAHIYYTYHWPGKDAVDFVN